MGPGKGGKERALLRSPAVLLIPTATSAAAGTGLLHVGASGGETWPWPHLQTLLGAGRQTPSPVSCPLFSALLAQELHQKEEKNPRGRM